MIRNLLRCALVTACCAGASTFAAIIDFGGLVGANGSPFISVVEEGFTVLSTQGEWRMAQISGNPTPSIFSNSAVAQVQVTGGEFRFLSMETNDGSRSSGISPATYRVEGFLSGQPVLDGTGQVSPEYEINLSPDTFQVLDRLLISIEGNGISSFNIDNIGVETIPEPASVLWAAAFTVGILVRRRIAVRGLS